MSSLLELSPKQLRQAARLKEKISTLESRLARIIGSTKPVTAVSDKPAKRGMSAAGRAAIAAGQKARWAKVHAAKGPANDGKPARKKRKMSAAGRAAIAAAAKARWAKAKAAGKSSL
jgi:hypothetical protein